MKDNPVWIEKTNEFINRWLPMASIVGLLIIAYFFPSKEIQWMALATIPSFLIASWIVIVICRVEDKKIQSSGVNKVMWILILLSMFSKYGVFPD